MNIQFSNELGTKGFYVYKITYQNGKPFYIGKGQNCRYKSHFLYNKKFELYRFIRKKLKTQSLRIVIIKDNLTEEKAFDLEKKFIKKYGRKDIGTGVLYNRTSGGQGEAGRIYSKETKRKISKGRIGEDNPFYGGHHSIESRKRISDGQRGRMQSEETIRKRVKKLKGQKRSLETKNKMSESHKGKKKSEETRRNMSKSAKRRWE